MSEYQYTPYPPINKEIPTTYPIPKCEPKKMIHLPPAATQPDLGMHPSIRYRSSDRPRSPHRSRPVPNLPHSRDHDQYADRHSTPTPPRPHRHASSSRHVPSSAPDPSASRSEKASGANALHGARPRVDDRAKEGDRSKKDNGKPYGAPKAAKRGSTIPRQGRPDSVRSPLSRSSAAGYTGSSRSRGPY